MGDEQRDVDEGTLAISEIDCGHPNQDRCLSLSDLY